MIPESRHLDSRPSDTDFFVSTFEKKTAKMTWNSSRFRSLWFSIEDNLLKRVTRSVSRWRWRSNSLLSFIHLFWQLATEIWLVQRIFTNQWLCFILRFSVYLYFYETQSSIEYFILELTNQATSFELTDGKFVHFAWVFLDVSSWISFVHWPWFVSSTGVLFFFLLQIIFDHL